jgi:hypothetical protein
MIAAKISSALARKVAIVGKKLKLRKSDLVRIGLENLCREFERSGTISIGDGKEGK